MAGRFSSWLTLTVAGRGDVSKCDSGGRANRGHVLKVFITPQRARADTLSRSAGHETPTATPRKVSHKLFMFGFIFFFEVEVQVCRQNGSSHFQMCV